MSIKIRRTVLLFLSLWVTPFFAFAQDVGILHLGPLNLELPATWTFDGSKRPIEGKGPDGERVLVTVMRPKSTAASEPSLSAQNLAEGFALGPMFELATRGDKKLVRPISEFPVPDGKAGYSAGSEASGLFGGKSYFVQYLLASPGALIYLTVEGKGEALAAMQRFDAFLSTQKWDE